MTATPPSAERPALRAPARGPERQPERPGLRVAQLAAHSAGLTRSARTARRPLTHATVAAAALLVAAHRPGPPGDREALALVAGACALLLVAAVHYVVMLIADREITTETTRRNVIAFKGAGIFVIGAVFLMSPGLEESGPMLAATRIFLFTVGTAALIGWWPIVAYRINRGGVRT